MKRHSGFGFLFLVWSAVAFCGTVSRIEYVEDFALSAGVSPAGRELGGDGPAWRVDGRVSGTGRGSVGAASGGAAWVPLEAGAASIRLRAMMDPSGSDWVAAAIGGGWGNAFYDTAQLWVLMRPSADYQIRADGGRLVLQTGKVPAFRRSGGNLVELRYDRADRVLAVTLNGETVYANALPASGGFRPALDSAGFKFNGPMRPSGSPEVSAVSVELAGEFPPRATLRLDDELGVYAPGVAPFAHVGARGLPGEGATLSLRAVDFSGRVVWSLDDAQTVGRGGVTATHRVEIGRRLGYFELSCVVRDAGGAVLAEASRPFVVIPEPPAEARTVANPFGAMVYPHIAYSAREKEIDARYMSRIGLRYVRTHRLNWLHIQPSPEDPFNWGDADREVDIYRRHGLRIIATTGWPVPRWASSARDLDLPESKGNFAPAPDAMEDARRFHRELAARYRDDIDFYEIGNEVDAHFWLGSAEHYREHDIPGILRDYRDYFAALSGAIRDSAPDARVAPGVTGAKEGHSYRPWLTSQMELGLGKLMTAYGPHYRADIGYANEVMARHGVKVPVIFTEIGGFSRNPGGSDPFGAEMRRVIRDDYHQMATQLTHPNVRALCKFILREQPTYGGEGVIHAGLLGVDFSLRPSYVAYATLVRSLAGARFVGRINLSRSATAGWGEGFAFERDGKRINLVFLHAMTPAAVRLRSTAGELVVVDVMGEVTRLPVADGVAELSISPDLPLIVVGPVEGEPGPVEIPDDTLVKEVAVTLNNPGFEQDAPDGVPGWGLMVDEQGAGGGRSERFAVAKDRRVFRGGAQSVRMDAPRPTRWYGITQALPPDQIPRPGPGEYLVFKVSAYAKGEAIHGKGLGYTLALRRSSGERLVFLGSPYFGFGGTYDWKELAGENRLDTWPEGAERVTLDLLLGLSTGTLWLDDVSVTVQLWRRGG